MLGKLLKHEFKDTGKVLLPLDLLLIGVTLLGMIVLGLKVFDHDGMAPVAAAMLIFYILGIIALFIVTYVFLMIRFFRSMYSSEGYLTHTLPVNPLATLNTKLIVSLFWAFLTLILSIGSVVSLILTAVRTYGEEISWGDLWPAFEKVTGFTAPEMLGWIMLFSFLTCLSGLLMIYCSISIGQLFNKHKVLAAIISYVVIYIVMQIVSTITMLGTSIRSISDESSISTQSGFVDMSGFYGSVFGSTMIQSVVFIAIFYVVTAYISSKKVNLD